MINLKKVGISTHLVLTNISKITTHQKTIPKAHTAKTLATKTTLSADLITTSGYRTTAIR